MSDTQEMTLAEGAEALAELAPFEESRHSVPVEGRGGQLADDEQEEERSYTLPDGSFATAAEVQEWKLGYLRQSDYTRKTMDLATQRKALQTQQQEMQQVTSWIVQPLTLALEVLRAHTPTEPDIDLAQTDPFKFNKERAIYDSLKEKLRQVEHALLQAKMLEDRQASQAMREYQAREAVCLLQKMPELRAPTRRLQYMTELVEFGDKLGFVPAEIAAINDHRVLLVADMAMRYYKLMANKPKADAKAKDAAPVQKPGMRRDMSARGFSDRKKRFDRLSTTGSMEDGAAVLLDLVRGDGR